LFEFSTHDELPDVTTLSLHLPSQQALYFPDQKTAGDLQERLDRSTSTLLAFFKYNSENVDGRQYLYHEFPEHFVYVHNVG